MGYQEKQYLPLSGVNVDVDSPTSTRGVDYLDYVEGLGVYGTKYFHDLIVGLRIAGYSEADGYLLGNPFDWRYPVWQNEYDTLKEMIEKFVEENPGKKMMLIAHSLGAVRTSYFLNRLVTAEWKAKHIEGFVSIAGAYGGSMKTVRTLLSGYGDATVVDFFNIVNISLIPPSVLRKSHRSFGSMYALTPNPEVFGEDFPLIKLHRSPLPPVPPPKSVWNCLIHSHSIAAASACILPKGRSQLAADISDASQSFLPIYQRRRVLGDINTTSPRENESDFSLNLEEENPELQLSSHHRLPIASKEEYSKNDQKAEKREISAFSIYQPSDIIETYTLKNWTSVLPPELQPMALQAQARMFNDDKLLQDPGVPVYCLWSSFSIPTTELSFEYFSDDFDISPAMTLDYGDNTVPVKSASWCSKWKSTVLSHQFENLDHMFMLFDPSFIRFVVSLISGKVTSDNHETLIYQ